MGIIARVLPWLSTLARLNLCQQCRVVFLDPAGNAKEVYNRPNCHRKNPNIANTKKKNTRNRNKHYNELRDGMRLFQIKTMRSKIAKKPAKNKRKSGRFLLPFKPNHLCLAERSRTCDWRWICLRRCFTHKNKIVLCYCYSASSMTHIFHCKPRFERKKMVLPSELMIGWSSREPFVVSSFEFEPSAFIIQMS